MLKAGIRNYRPKLRRVDYIPSFIRYPVSPLCIRTSRALHTASRQPSRRNYGGIFLGLASASLLGGLIFYASNSKDFVPHGNVHADADTPVPPEKDKEETETEEPLEDFTTCPPPVYARFYWDPPAAKPLEEALSYNSRIYNIDPPCGIPRYDVSVVPSGSNVACFSSASLIELPTHYWVFFGIYDGHNGNEVASHLAHNLRHAIMGALADLFSKHATMPDAHVDLGGSPDIADYWTGAQLGRPYPPAEEYDAAIKQAFMIVDKVIVDEVAERAIEAAKRYRNDEPEQENLLSYGDAAGLVSRAHCGSSAVVAVYESDTRQLRMANTGDSRAVLGRRVVDDRGEESYEVHVLTHDMVVPSGFIDDPPKRAHKPVQLMHAFGDGPWKWNVEQLQQLNDAFPFIVSNENPHTKVTAEPTITTIETQPGDFLVLANQGFWSSLTNEEAVGLVGLWLKKYRRFVYRDSQPEDGDAVTVYDPETLSVVRSSPRVPASSVVSTSFLRKDVFEQQDLPVQRSGEKDDTFMYRMWGIPKRFVNVDRNVAQHLVRNAIGGADRDLMEALLKMTMPRSRRYRNDVSVEVVFFN